MLRIHEFYRKFEEITPEDRLRVINYQAKPTSLLVIFKQLGEVRAQKRYFEEREEYLLKLAEVGLKKIHGEHL